MEPRRDGDWLRRKIQDLTRRVEALENGRRLDPSGTNGLGRPWLSLGPVWITGNSFWGASTSALPVKLAYAQGVCQHPYQLVLFQWRILDGATTGSFDVLLRWSDEAKVIVIPGTFVGPTGAGINDYFLVACPTTDFPTLLTVEIRGTRLTGTGSVEAHVDTILGCGTEDNPFPVIT